MKKLFAIVFIAIAIVLVTPHEARAGYADRGGAIGVGLSSDISTLTSLETVLNDKDFRFGDSFGLNINGKIGNAPIVLGVDLSFLLNGTQGIESLEKLDFTFDWWLINPTLFSVGIFSLGFYIAPGLNLGIHIAETGNENYKWYEPFYMDLGVRLPMGLSFVLFDHLEIYTELLLALNLVQLSVNGEEAMFGYYSFIEQGSTFEDVWNNQITKSINVGVRYWF